MHKVLHDEFGKPLKAEWVDNGIKVNYHRINNLTVNDGVVSVKIISYTDKTYREKEIENMKIENEFVHVYNFISESNPRDLHFSNHQR